MSSKKLFSKFLAKSLLIPTAVSCFGCCVSAMEIENNYNFKTNIIINDELVYRILKNSIQWVMLRRLEKSKDTQGISALLRDTKINFNIDLLKRDVVEFLDKEYFKDVKEIYFRYHVAIAKKFLEKSSSDDFIRASIIGFLGESRPKTTKNYKL